MLDLQNVTITGVTAWYFAFTYPEKVEKLVVLNAPHPQLMYFTNETLSVSQLIKSWYIFFHFIPALPEYLYTRNNFSTIIEAGYQRSLPNAYSLEDIKRSRQAWSEPNALTSALNWYRAIPRILFDGPFPNPMVNTPTLFLWGALDSFLGVENAYKSLKYCTNCKLVILPNATHWVQRDQFEAVNWHIQYFVENQ